jgi:hypothetical protein
LRRSTGERSDQGSMSIFVGVAERNLVTVFIPLPSVRVAYPHAQGAVSARLHQPNRFVNPFGQKMSTFNLNAHGPGPLRCMKMTRRSPDERLRTAADCLSRLRDLRPDPMPMPFERHHLQVVYELITLRRDRSGLRARCGEFQPSFETVHPGGGAHLFSVLHSIFVLNFCIHDQHRYRNVNQVFSN